MNTGHDNEVGDEEADQGVAAQRAHVRADDRVDLADEGLDETVQAAHLEFNERSFKPGINGFDCWIDQLIIKCGFELYLINLQRVWIELSKNYTEQLKCEFRKGFHPNAKRLVKI